MKITEIILYCMEAFCASIKKTRKVLDKNLQLGYDVWEVSGC